MNQLETKRTVKESTKPRAGSLKRINKIDKPLAKLTKRHRDSIQINKIWNEKGDITEMRKFKKSSEPTTKVYTRAEGKGGFGDSIWKLNKENI